MRNTRSVGLGLSALCLMAAACGSSGAGGTGGSSGTGGSTSGSGGSTSGTGGSTSGTGGASGAFTSVPPCTTEASYATTGTTVAFGTAGAVYNPKCLKVAAGSSVTFSGDFSLHPLSPSALRGTLAGHPITHTGSGTSKSFTFPAAGYYAYFCDLHGPSDGAAGMVGVVWVQ